ncbi:MAG TPA: ATP synthase archaeal subunit H [Methanosarcinaceae archaeon]|nr:ATP synthase archaeal subunit H [Methanosarcinaceae archaeon]
MAKSKNDILYEIKKAEENASQIVDEAAKNKNERITSARGEAREIVKQAEIDAHESAQKSLKSAEAAIKGEKVKIIDEGRVDAKAIVEETQTNVDKAVDYLVSEFERTTHA